MSKFEYLFLECMTALNWNFYVRLDDLNFECVVGGEIVNWTYRFDYFLRIDCSGTTSHFIVSVSVVIASNYPGRNLKWMATHLTILISSHLFYLSNSSFQFAGRTVT